MRQEKITLKNVEEQDFEILIEMENSDSTRIFAEDETPFPKTKEECLAFLKVEKPGHFWGIYLNEETLIGGCLVYNFNSLHLHCEIGITMLEKYQNQGYGSIAIKQMITTIFENIPVHKIKLEVFSFNEPAIHLYEKIGFRLEGKLCEEIFRFGKYHDLLLYGLLREEWE